MSWLVLVLSAHSVSAALLLVLLVAVLRESRRSVAHRAFTGLLAGSLAWLAINFISEILTVSGRPNQWLGACAGIAIQVMTVATFILCESLPARNARDFSAWTQGGKRDPRRPIIRIALVAVGCIFFAALSFSPEWIANRRLLADGSTGADYGKWFRASGIWSGVVVGWGLFLLYGKYVRETEAAIRAQLALFWSGIALSFGVGLVFAYLLPLAGNSRLFFLGVDSSIVLVTTVAYATLFRGLFDLRTALLRTGFRLILAGVLASAIYAAFLVLILNRNLTDFSGEFALVLSLFFLAAFVFGQRVLPLTDRLFVRKPPPLERVVPGLFQILAHESGDDLASVVQQIDVAFPTRRSFVCTTDPADIRSLRLHRRSCAIELDASTVKFLRRLFAVRVLPAQAVQAWERIFVLAEIPDDLPGDLAHRYPRVTRVLKTAFAALAREDFRILSPFLYNRRFAGFIALGEKSDDFPFYNRDLEYLETLRLSLGVLFQFRRTIQEIEASEKEARSDLNRLTQYLRDTGDRDPTDGATRTHVLTDRTILYRSQAMRSVAEQIEKIAGSERQPVLITGETGTGKEIIARMIHAESNPDQPFVAVNCAAIAENLWEDELFGHVKGAFTDAKGERAGRVREAGDGILFFDEIGEMPLEMQAKLLRLLQEHVFSPVGSDATIEARCRFIFATNRALPEMIFAGRFREDLFYRINVLPITAPALRDRPEDIVLLFKHYLESAHARRGTPPPAIEPAAAGLLERYAWPGNIRELENLAVRLSALHQSPTIGTQDLPVAFRAAPRARTRPRVIVTEHRIPESEQTLREMVDDYTRRILIETLKKTNGNRTQAAELLGVKRGSLLYRMKELGVE